MTLLTMPDWSPEIWLPLAGGTAVTVLGSLGAAAWNHLSGLQSRLRKAEASIATVDDRIETHERLCEERRSNQEERHAETQRKIDRLTHTMDGVDSKVERVLIEMARRH